MTTGETLTVAYIIVVGLFMAELIAVTRVKASISTAERRPAVVCTVEPDPSNRWVDIGVVDGDGFLLRSSATQLDGEDSPRTHRFPLPLNLDCQFGEDVTGFCDLYDTTHRVARATAPLHCPK